MKAWTNYWLDVLIALSFGVAALSGLVLWPALGLFEHYDNLFGIDLLTWSDIHSLSGVVMTVGVAAHLWLHRRWLASMTRRALGQLQAGTPRPTPSALKEAHHEGR